MVPRPEVCYLYRYVCFYACVYSLARVLVFACSLYVSIQDTLHVVRSAFVSDHNTPGKYFNTSLPLGDRRILFVPLSDFGIRASF